MPRNVRNFWIDCEVDNKKTPIKTGPRRKTGGFNMNIYVRENSEVSRDFVRIEGECDGEQNVITITFPDGRQEHLFFKR